MFRLRQYQQVCHEKLVAHLKKNIDPCLIDASPAAGKSFLIAAIANFLYNASGGKRVLCLAPSKELVEQNVEKYRLTGEQCSIFSASAGYKSTKHPVIFGTPLTVLNHIDVFLHNVSGVIIDEAHGITKTIKEIITRIREVNTSLRVIGFSGTPFRLGYGYIFKIDHNGRVLSDELTRDPYFLHCVHRISAREMLEAGYITPMEIGRVDVDTYDTSNLRLNSLGKFDAEEIDRAFVGHGRKTAAIVADVIEKSRGLQGGVMLFAATIKHAEEIMSSLPPSISALVTGDTPKADRKKIIDKYKRQDIRYLVNVGTLTTGFDVPHTQVIALLRKTESASLLQQILGRAWRLHPDKEKSYVFDYANNIDFHFPDGDIYNPEIRATKSKEKGSPLKVKCPSCSYVNDFSCRPEYVNSAIDENGYVLDVFGERIETEYGPMPAHFGRRCMGYVNGRVAGQLERCGYYWTFKECPVCEAKNDIAARYCFECKAEIIDPNEKLVGEFKALKKDPYKPQCDEVLSMDAKPGISRNGNDMIRVEWVTPWRRFTTYFTPKFKIHYDKFMKNTEGGKVQPKTIAYRKVDDKFFEILGYNLPPDVEPKRG